MEVVCCLLAMVQGRWNKDGCRERALAKGRERERKREVFKARDVCKCVGCDACEAGGDGIERC